MDGTPDGVRLPPLPLQEWPVEMRGAVAALRPPVIRHPLPQRDDRPKGLNALGTLARHPELTRAWHAFNGHVLMASSIAPRERELLILRVAALRNSTYEWEQHVVLAQDNGLTRDDIDRIAAGPDSPGWAPLDRAMVRGVDELIAEARISDATWAELAQHLDEQQLMDLVFTVGAYEVLAMAFNTFGVELDDDLRK